MANKEENDKCISKFENYVLIFCFSDSVNIFCKFYVIVVILCNSCKL